jgi:hypothetical protein
MISEYLEERKSRFKNEEYENEPPLKRHFNKFIESNDLTSRYLDEKNKIQRQIRDWKIIIEEKEDRLDRKIER